MMEKCQDCDTINKLHRVEACVDQHTHCGTDMCCYKDICVNGCTYSCTECSSVNMVVMGQDNYCVGFNCYKCRHMNPIEVIFFGNLKFICERYCDMGCYDNETFIVNGTNGTE